MVVCSSGDATTIDPNQVTDVVWEWETYKVTTRFDNEAHRPIQESITIPNRENYTLILRDGGTFSGRADCSEINGTYSTAGGYAFTLAASTIAINNGDSGTSFPNMLLGISSASRYVCPAHLPKEKTRLFS